MDLDDLFAPHGRALLAFNGGKESLALQCLCAPWRDRITLLWVNTGFAFPHMATFIRRAAEGWDLRVVESDLRAEWNSSGTPADVVPVDHWPAVNTRPKEPRLQPWRTCCTALKGRPLLRALETDPDATLLLHGQRDEDGSTMAEIEWLGSREIAAPLWTWSTAEVFAYLDRHGVELPPQYAFGPKANSLDCWVCPADLTPERLMAIRTFRAEQGAAVTAHAARVLGPAARRIAGVHALLSAP